MLHPLTGLTGKLPGALLAALHTQGQHLITTLMFSIWIARTRARLEWRPVKEQIEREARGVT
jgi:hypothetical protein